MKSPPTRRATLIVLAGLRDKHVTNGAMVVLDATGTAIRAMVGSADYFDPATDGQVNLALAPRQPGSAPSNARPPSATAPPWPCRTA